MTYEGSSYINECPVGDKQDVDPEAGAFSIGRAVGYTYRDHDLIGVKYGDFQQLFNPMPALPLRTIYTGNINGNPSQALLL
jgi:hypothetical protein